MYVYDRRPGNYPPQFLQEQPFPSFPPVYEAMPPAPPINMYHYGQRPVSLHAPIMSHYLPYSGPINGADGAEAFSTKQILGQFKTNEGYYDIDKMVNTFGQVMNTVHSAVPILKQFGSFIGR